MGNTSCITCTRANTVSYCALILERLKSHKCSAKHLHKTHAVFTAIRKGPEATFVDYLPFISSVCSRSTASNRPPLETEAEPLKTEAETLGGIKRKQISRNQNRESPQRCHSNHYYIVHWIESAFLRRVSAAAALYCAVCLSRLLLGYSLLTNKKEKGQYKAKLCLVIERKKPGNPQSEQ